MRRRLLVSVLTALPALLAAQATHKFPPDSLENVDVIPRSTPVPQVIATMRTFAQSLGVRCTHCHVGEDGKPLTTYDFPSDDKTPKEIARQMMRMVAEVNRRLDTLPDRDPEGLQVTCLTCHRGYVRPVPLATLMTETASTSGLDSATRTYRALRTRYYGSDAFNFSERSLNDAALRLARDNHPAEAAGMLALNEEFFPSAASIASARGTIALLKGDTTAARAAFREALRRDPNDREAQGRLRDLGAQR
ncbi:MAG: c-type cytochrome [Gemmatimonadetes bacterium]|nr:c-type cytochrome [Gemmatimonadota bacterium]